MLHEGINVIQITIFIPHTDRAMMLSSLPTKEVHREQTVRSHPRRPLHPAEPFGDGPNDSQPCPARRLAGRTGRRVLRSARQHWPDCY
ncbi:hypothetical protein CBM2592_B40243 [Cupriavidus taiwanensis]|nr:hypothetical protein CBM2592_B40243 [Cupriavidus taiwanensis]SOY72105.1 hypothetical protein CBM2588_B40060 [Cupriavidus taiwanensis]SOY95670.1 hypothetical protein CBM2591_B20241 [Cupriavidus taiwanensis]SOZ29956.1 hypothetical protein CBM2608_B30268 [Cupriavidus taiwanensis]SOZ88415.1 hypothetical protein CBM2618_B50159 [Cupriavidus taiwanensis]